MFDRVLILSASAGAGHLRAADALEKAFGVLGGAREVRHVDVLQYTNALFRRLYSRVYLDMVNTMPEVLGWLYDRLDDPDRDERLQLAFEKLNARPFVKLVERYQPDVVVCTHFLPAEIVSGLKGKGRLAARQAIVVTDFDVHSMWLCPNYEQYFVALDETRAHLMELGVPGSKVAVTGIPIDPVFATPKDPAGMRKKHGLEPDRVTILISAGGFGVGRVETVLKALEQLKHRSQVVANCGRNQALFEELKRRFRGQPADAVVRFEPIGYTTEMDEWMAASDLLVGKPGGLTTSEALARGLVPVVVQPIPGQEERNADHLLEEGAAIRCNNLPVLAYKIDRLIDDPARLASLRANALRLARPRAALDVVERLLSLWNGAAEVSPPPPKKRRVPTVRPRREPKV